MAETFNAPPRGPFILDAVVHFYTHYGQQIGIVGDHPSLGSGKPGAGPVLQYEAGGLWRGRIAVSDPCILRYRYFLLNDNGETEIEWGEERELDLTAAGAPTHVELRETWRAPGILGGFFHPTMTRYAFSRDVTVPRVPSDSAVSLASAALAAAVLQGPLSSTLGRAARSPHTRYSRVRFLLHEPRVSAGHAVVVCGSAQEIGNWDPQAAPRMLDSQFPLWVLEVELPSSRLPLEYKFVVVERNPPAGIDPTGNGGRSGAGMPPAKPYGWEDGENRRLDAPEYAQLGCLDRAERIQVAKELLEQAGATATITAGPAAPRDLVDPLRDFSSDAWVRRPRLPQPSAFQPPAVTSKPPPKVDEMDVASEIAPVASATAGNGVGRSALSSGNAALVALSAPVASATSDSKHRDIDDKSQLHSRGLLSPGAVTAAIGSRPSSRERDGGALEDAPPTLQLSSPPHALLNSGALTTLSAGATELACANEAIAPAAPAEAAPHSAQPRDYLPLSHAPAAGHPQASPAPPSSHGDGDTLILAHAFMIRMEARPWRAASLCIPVFSLRSDRGLGVGEFADLCALVDWASSVGLRMVHILPVNDTTASGTAEDSSPHRVSSAFALHPLYISLEAVARPEAYGDGFSLGTASDGAPISSKLPPSFAQRVETARAQLSGGSSLTQGPGGGAMGSLGSPAGNSAKWGFGGYGGGGQLYGRVGERCVPREPLDYDGVMRTKMALLRDLYRGIGDHVLATSGFARWFRSNHDWLQPYALFSFFRDLHGTPDTSQWGTRRAVSQAQLHSLTDASQFHYRSVAFWYFVQYLAHVQLLGACGHAAGAGVILQVDVPFGVLRGSVDVWAQPELFKLSKVVGTPPDAANALGRRGDIVPYDWEVMAADKHSWWSRRLRQVGAYFPSARLSQVGEYFRTYELPSSAVTGLGGVFSPSAGFSDDELVAAGVSRDELLPRLTQPYVREWTARAALGPDYADLVPLYFDIAPSTGAYAFKPGLASEAALRDACRGSEGISGSGSSGGGSTDPTCLTGLVQLLQNVCLIETVEPPRAPGGKPRRRYHPRTDMQKTTSFLELPEATRKTLASIYALYFTQRAPDTWRAVGRARLSALQALAPRVLLYSDDPLPRKGISDVLYALGVPGVRSHRLPGGEELQQGVPRPLMEYGCVATPSTPDMPPIRSWWEEDASLSARFFYTVLGGQGPAPPTCTTAVAASVLKLYAGSGCEWSEFQLQDLLAMDAALRGHDAHAERINVPSVPRHVWRWRMPVTVQELLGELGAGFRRELRALLEDTGRA